MLFKYDINTSDTHPNDKISDTEELMENNSNNCNMDVKMPSPATAAVKKKRSKPLALTDAAQKAKLDRFVQEMAKFEKEQEAKARACAVVPSPPPAVDEQSMWIYQLPPGLNQISSSVKVDDPPTKMRIGQLSTFIEKLDPLTGLSYWVGLTWAETFYPVEGEKPSTVVGSKAYEVVLKQPFDNGGQIVRENVATTGKVVGIVIADLPHETVSIVIDDWFVQSDVFKKGRWEQQKMARRPDHAS